mgnify:FL=1
MDGVVIINKPKGMTSQNVVSKVKRILNEKKVGHAGTLDPNATGVLPILVGKATKISKYLIEHDKSYEAIIKLGEKSSTGDIEGDIVEKKEIKLDKYTSEDIQNILNMFLGKTKQIPPMYSAIKVNGKKLYEYAREGKEVELKERDIEIFNIQLKNVDYENQEISYIVDCSKGTYIRTLCEDIAKKLNTVGYMKELTRLRVDKFNISNAITLEELEEKKNNSNFEDIIPIESLFSDKPKIILTNKKENLFLNGVKLTFNNEDGTYLIYNEKKSYVGLGIIKDNLLKRDVV